MPTSEEPNTQRRIVAHAVLVGLTPLIPVPFLDDVVKEYFLRRLMRSLGEARDTALSEEDVHALADDPGGCLGCGCMAKILLLPIRKLIRKILIFLEWKRAIDLVSITYHRGYLVDYALEQGWLGPEGQHSGLDVRAAIDAVIAEIGVKPVERVVSSTFSTSKGAVRAAAKTLAEAVRGLGERPSSDEVMDVLEAIEPREEKNLSGVIDVLRRGLSGLPKEHYQQLRTRFAARLTSSARRLPSADVESRTPVDRDPANAVDDVGRKEGSDDPL